MQVGDRVWIESDDDFDGESGVIKMIDDGVVFWVLVQARLVPCEKYELVTLEDSEEKG